MHGHRVWPDVLKPLPDDYAYIHRAMDHDDVRHGQGKHQHHQSERQQVHGGRMYSSRPAISMTRSAATPGAAPTKAAAARRRASRLGAVIAFHPSDAAHTTSARKTTAPPKSPSTPVSNPSSGRCSPASQRHVTYPQPDRDRRECGDEHEVAGHDPFEPGKPAIEGQTIRKRDTEKHERGCRHLSAERRRSR